MLDTTIRQPPELSGSTVPPSIPALIRGLTAVAAAVIDLDGGYLDGNQGFAWLLNRNSPPRRGERIARWFVQPDFAELLAMTGPGANGAERRYSGRLSLGDPDQVVRTLQVEVRRRDDCLLVLGEHDIGELERLNAAMFQLNEELAEKQRALVRANRALVRDRAEIERLMLTDPLTGAANRRCFDDRCARALARLGSGPSEPVSLILADIDHFKQINDRFGHAAGDDALVVFTRVMQGHTRGQDLVARYGGEEFCILMPGCTLRVAARAAERIRTAFSDTRIEGIDAVLSASFGVAEASAGQSEDQLLHAADQALYRAKDLGRNRVECAQD